MLLRQEEVISNTELLLKEITSFVRSHGKDLKQLSTEKNYKKSPAKIFSSLKKILTTAGELQSKLEQFVHKNGDLESMLINSFLSAGVMTGINVKNIKDIKKINDFIVNYMSLIKTKLSIDEEGIAAFLKFAKICQANNYDQYLSAWIGFQDLDQGMHDALRVIEETESNLYLKKDVLDKMRILELEQNDKLVTTEEEIKNCNEQKVILENTYKQLSEIKRKYAAKIAEFDCSLPTLHETVGKLSKALESLRRSHHKLMSDVAYKISNILRNYMGGVYTGESARLAA